MKPRIGVLFNDSSILIVMDRNPDGSARSDEEQREETRDLLEGANAGQRDKKNFAKLVSIDLEPADVVEIEDEA